MLDYIRRNYTEREVADIDNLLDPSQWVTFDVAVSPVGIICVRAAPGNGTEYRFVLVPASMVQDAFPAIPDDGYFLAMWPGSGWGTMSTRIRDTHPDYIAEKLFMRKPDAVAMSIILDRIGMEVVI